uniref:Protein kinase domain-containing protein n=1 Tax=Rhodosorus marinus TaxID=101924 RepID=A0A7S2ZBA1_9RHOD|mmetsp:Transcript_12657/g.51155  ORF Transcript_12657/g.51155 Transcript_12657/m.51155 type:complete len:324 (+) Transcript_12657:578-1549(+)
MTFWTTETCANTALPVQSLSKYYTLQREIGQGKSCKVFLASTISSNDLLAVRVLDLNGRKAKETAILLRREVHFLRFVRSPFVVRAYDFFVDKDSAQIVAELMDYGSIGSVMEKEVVQSLTERQVAWIMFQVLSGLRDLHGMGVIHRDVSLHSVMMQYNPGNPDTPIVKLADLGLACSSANTHAEDFVVGALVNIAPEVFRKQKCGKEVDLWASGLLCYHLLVGHHPLRKMDRADIAFELGTRGRILYREQEWTGVSRAARDFTEALLEFEPAKRTNTEAALVHSFLAEAAQRFNHMTRVPAIRPKGRNLQAGSLFGQGSRHC